MTCSEILKLGGSDPRRPKQSLNLPPSAQCPSYTEYHEGLKKSDGPSAHAHPVNITIIQALVAVLNRDDPKFGARWSHLINLAIIAFYWLLQPCECLFNNTDPDDGNTVPYELRHVQLTIAGPTYSARAAPLHDSTSIDSITAAYLQLDDQKNGTKGRIHRPHRNHRAPSSAQPKCWAASPCATSSGSGPILTPLTHLAHENSTNPLALLESGTRSPTDTSPPPSGKQRPTSSDITRIPTKLISACSMCPGGWRHSPPLRRRRRRRHQTCRTLEIRLHAPLYLSAQALVVGECFAQKMLNTGRCTIAPMALQSDPLSLPQDITPAVDGIRQLFAAGP